MASPILSEHISTLNQTGADALADFRRYLEAERGLAPSTITAYTCDLERWRGLLGGVLYPCDRRTITAAIANLLESGVSPQSVARRLSALRTLYRYLMRRRIIVSNPLRGVTSPQFEKRLPTPPSKIEMERLLDACETTTLQGKRDYALIAMLEASGLRISEAVRLQASDVHLGERYLMVHAGKGDKDRIAPLNDRAIAAIRDYQASRLSDEGPLFPISRQRAWQILADASQSALGRHVHPHELRHLLGTELAKRLELREVADLLGHESIDTTQFYLALDLDGIEKAFYQCHPRGKIHEGN
jgi:site-specific recombinase XerD